MAESRQIDVELAAERPIHVPARDSLLAAAIIVGLPNLLFLLLSPWFLIRRALSPLLYLLAAILAFLLPAPFAYLLFLMAAIADVFFIIAFAFDMPFSVGFESVRYLHELDIAASPLYIAGAVFFLALPLTLAFVFNRYRARLRQASILPALVVAVLVGAADLRFNHFKPLALPSFESAMGQSGMTADSIVANDRNILIVIVEGMGAFAVPAERELLAAMLRKAAGDRYRFTTGTSNYYGSTTGATSRELCGQWRTFTHYLSVVDHDCLPEKLARAGFQTANYHASTSELFSRRVWYPRIGIQKLNFREDIEKERPEAVKSLCGSVFKGICDRDIGDLVHGDLLAAGDQRQFKYWLTLNSHLPYAPIPSHPLKCGMADAAIDAQIPCELTEIWMDVFSKVAEIASDPKMPPLDIIVVGDHNTPMWSRSAFGHFVDGKVDWYHLEDTRGSEPQSDVGSLRGTNSPY